MSEASLNATYVNFHPKFTSQTPKAIRIRSAQMFACFNNGQQDELSDIEIFKLRHIGVSPCSLYDIFRGTYKLHIYNFFYHSNTSLVITEYKFRKYRVKRAISRFSISFFFELNDPIGIIRNVPL